jgi:hypothetical protein
VDGRALVSTVALGLLAAGSMAPSADAACLSDLWGRVTCGAGPCSTDLYGNVYCAQFRFGSIVTTRTGQVVCGKGGCVTTLRGEVICSNIDGGGVVTQIDGKVRCEGQCEAASLSLCEQTPAGQLESP